MVTSLNPFIIIRGFTGSVSITSRANKNESILPGPPTNIKIEYYLEVKANRKSWTDECDTREMFRSDLGIDYNFTELCQQRG